MEKLIFAPLIRVSTESQEKRGESLNTQRRQLESAIHSLGGEIYYWYAGQEHATPEQDRIILDKLILDAKEGKFNAIIVCDTSRWSRDNRRNKEDLEILKHNRIRFFVGVTEYNLYDPTSSFMLSMSVEIAEFHAKEQTYKSILNRISRAEKGYPACGKMPHGRKFDRINNKWSVDEDKKRTLEEIAYTYLAEDIGYNELGKRFKMNGANIHKLLIERSGTLWEQHFVCKSLNIDTIVPTKVPRLLSDNIIKRIKEKSLARRTYAHGSYKYEYLFSRNIFDSTTGHALTGTPNSAGQRYYKPYQGSMANRYMVNADILESAVMEGLNELLLNKEIFNKAIYVPIPLMSPPDSEGKRHAIPKDVATLFRIMSPLRGRSEATLVFGCLS